MAGQVAAAEQREARLFHGWVIVGAVFLAMFAGFGISYSFSAFFTSLKEEFDASRGAVSLVFSITTLVYCFVGVGAGLLADRIAPRRIVIAGVGLVALGLAATSQAQELWHVYVTYGFVVGLGIGCIYVPAIGTVQRWFVRKRGTASGLAVTGIGAGTLSFPILAAALIDQFGWRDSYLLLAAVVLAVGLPAGLLLERSPAARGLHPDGDRMPAGTVTAAPAGLPLRSILRARDFQLLCWASLAMSFGFMVPFVHLVPYAEDHGIARSTGSVLIGCIGVGSILGRVVTGRAADRVGRRTAMMGSLILIALSLFAWTLATELWSLVAFALAFGAFYGAAVPLNPALAADYFNGRNLGAVIGLITAPGGVGSLLGPLLAGVLYDQSGTYAVGIAMAGGMNVLAAGFILLMRPPAPAHSVTGSVPATAGASTSTHTRGPA
ncbi:MAG: MFS transporter [Dehalococcoidia bacterium]|nr:MFS transporter [Dehalococcoidia bacterium]